MKYKGLIVRSKSELAKIGREGWRKVGLEVDEDLLWKMQDEARQARCSFSELIRSILAAWLEGKLTIATENPPKEDKNEKKQSVRKKA